MPSATAPRSTRPPKPQQGGKPRRIPRQYKPEHLSLDEWQIALRRQDGPEKKWKMEQIGDHPVYGDFRVTNPETHTSEKVAIRSEESGLNFCSCQDFRTNTLGTCEHCDGVHH